MSERNFYVLCDDNCRFPAMTKEQIIEAIAEATGATPTHIDDAFITKLKELNKNKALTFWVGSKAEYNALPDEEKDVRNRLYIYYDEGEYEDLETQVAEIKSSLETLTETVRTLGETVGTLSDDVDEIAVDVAILKTDYEKKGVVLFNGTLPFGYLEPQIEINADILNYSMVIVEALMSKFVCMVSKRHDTLYFISGANVNHNANYGTTFSMSMIDLSLVPSGDKVYISRNASRFFDFLISEQSGRLTDATAQNFKIIGIM